jgi:hypothetical protein
VHIRSQESDRSCIRMLGFLNFLFLLFSDCILELSDKYSCFIFRYSYILRNYISRYINKNWEFTLHVCKAITGNAFTNRQDFTILTFSFIICCFIYVNGYIVFFITKYCIINMYFYLTCFIYSTIYGSWEYCIQRTSK